MSCTFKQYLAENYKLKKIKSLKSLVSKAGTHGVNQHDTSTGDIGESYKLIKLQDMHTTEPKYEEGHKLFKKSRGRNIFYDNPQNGPYPTGAKDWDDGTDYEEDEENVDYDKRSDYNDSSAHKNRHPLADYLNDDSDDKGKSHNKDHDKKDHKPDKDKDTKNKDPDKQGLIRKIDGAHLIYKRVNEDGTYNELWMYNVSRGNKNEYDIRSEILASTDIEQKSGVSASGNQKYILWTNNNVQMMQVTGLPN
jgi:hypothetical protein